MSNEDQIKRDYYDNLEMFTRLGALQQEILTDWLARSDIKHLGVHFRVKDILSILEHARGKKAVRSLRELKDVVGVRIVVRTLADATALSDSFDEIYSGAETDNKTARLETDRFGYLAVHKVCPMRLSAGVNSRRSDWPFETQIRTAIQDAWAHVSHRLIYKKNLSPDANDRRLSRLAGLLEIADEELQELDKVAVRRDYEHPKGHRPFSLNGNEDIGEAIVKIPEVEACLAVMRQEGIQFSAATDSLDEQFRWTFAQLGWVDSSQIEEWLRFQAPFAAQVARVAVACHRVRGQRVRVRWRPSDQQLLLLFLVTNQHRQLDLAFGRHPFRGSFLKFIKRVRYRIRRREMGNLGASRRKPD